MYWLICVAAVLRSRSYVVAEVRRVLVGYLREVFEGIDCLEKTFIARAFAE